MKIIKTWPKGALSKLQDCFECTELDVFVQQDLEEYTETLLFYIKNCTDNVTVNKKCNNQKA